MLVLEAAQDDRVKKEVDLLELVGAPAGGRTFVRAPPPLICPGPGGLRHTPTQVRANTHTTYLHAQDLNRIRKCEAKKSFDCSKCNNWLTFRNLKKVSVKL